MACRWTAQARQRPVRHKEHVQILKQIARRRDHCVQEAPGRLDLHYSMRRTGDVFNFESSLEALEDHAVKRVAFGIYVACWAHMRGASWAHWLTISSQARSWWPTPATSIAPLTLSGFLLTDSRAKLALVDSVNVSDCHSVASSAVDRRISISFPPMDRKLSVDRPMDRSMDHRISEGFPHGP